MFYFRNFFHPCKHERSVHLLPLGFNLFRCFGYNICLIKSWKVSQQATTWNSFLFFCGGGRVIY
jgi:hypothetical protein